jgi:hypothetical protein
MINSLIRKMKDLRGADLSGDDLRNANLRGADLRGANLSDADLSSANLRGADLRSANLEYANLSSADLRGADLEDANLNSADLRGTDLSGTTGLVSPFKWMKQKFDMDKDGYIVYKTFGLHYALPNYWVIEPDSIIEEVVDPLPTIECGCGVNFATKKWCKNNHPTATLWQCLIKWQWLPSVVVPYNTAGKARCEKLMLLKEITENE